MQKLMKHSPPLHIMSQSHQNPRSAYASNTVNHIQKNVLHHRGFHYMMLFLSVIQIKRMHNME